MALLAIQNLSFYYPGQRAPALRELSLALEPGEFVTLCGPSGCGKSTLLRLLKPDLAPAGRREGRIFFQGNPLDTLERRKQTQAIGYVGQSPENQVVTDKVWHELAFGLESLGLPQPVIRRRVAEMAAFFGMQAWFHRDVASLSGGQKQILNLASVLILEPTLLILDEPTSQLDPTAAADFLESLSRINQELGVTVLLCEHRLEHAFALSPRVIILDEGAVLCQGSAAQVGQRLKELSHPMAAAMPVPMEIYASVDSALPCPVSTAQGRTWLTAYAETHPLAPVPPPSAQSPAEAPVLEAQGLWFRYEKEQPWVLQDLTLRLFAGQCLALLGQNGAGKSTALALLAGFQKPERGSILQRGHLAALPQNPQTLFVRSTVRGDLADALWDRDLAQTEIDRRVQEMAELCRIGQVLDRHPYDLSGGEQQRAALAKVLLTGPQILLLDEPTKGLDGAMKRVLAAILRDCTQAGAAVLLVSHDMEFCARYADQCVLLSEGSGSVPARPQVFFAENLFYTTCASRIARDLLPGAVTPEDVIFACGGLPRPLPDPKPTPALDAPVSSHQTPTKRPLRRALAWFFGLAALWTCLMATRTLPQIFPELGTYGLLFLSLGGLAAATWRRAPRSQAPLRLPLGPATYVAVALLLVLMPLTILFGPRVFSFAGTRSYYATSLLVILEAIVPFFVLFEGRKPQARELVLLASLCALNVAGRAAFFMVPQCKPVAALTILTAIAFGGETGFLVGALTMLLSNLFYGQGAYTPWQMFAMGLVGFLAGLLWRLGLLRRSRTSLCVYGFLSVLLIYGFLMDASGVFLWQGPPKYHMLLAYCISGFPMNLVHAVGTVFFLWFGGLPILEKLERVKVKYGLLR